MPAEKDAVNQTRPKEKQLQKDVKKYFLKEYLDIKGLIG